MTTYTFTATKNVSSDAAIAQLEMDLTPLKIKPTVATDTLHANLVVSNDLSGSCQVTISFYDIAQAPTPTRLSTLAVASPMPAKATVLASLVKVEPTFIAL